jgi:hypothetical protein
LAEDDVCLLAAHVPRAIALPSADGANGLLLPGQWRHWQVPRRLGRGHHELA